MKLPQITSEGIPGCLSPTFQTEDLAFDALVTQTLPLIANR